MSSYAYKTVNQIFKGGMESHDFSRLSTVQMTKTWKPSFHILFVSSLVEFLKKSYFSS